MLRGDVKKNWIWPIRSNMRADAIGLFPKKVTKCRLLFFEKIRFEDFWITGRDGNSDRWDRVRNYILSGRCTEGGALCAGNAKGRSSMLGLRGKAHYRVKGETPCPVIWCLRQVVLGIIWRIVLPKIVFGNDRHMKKACGMQEADNGKTTEEGRMGKRKMKKCRMDERRNQKNESYKA